MENKPEPLKRKIEIIKFNYLTKEEQELEWHLALLQIVLGLQSCNKKENVIELLQDVRALEQKRTLLKFKSAIEWLKKEFNNMSDFYGLKEESFRKMIDKIDEAFADVIGEEKDEN